tara:strand:+ start:2330 stop:2512 length:183 start_codon:yes stop_codon:yes gene_type:complete
MEKDKNNIPLEIKIPVCYSKDDNDNYKLDSDFLIDTFSDMLKQLQKDIEFINKQGDRNGN